MKILWIGGLLALLVVIAGMRIFADPAPASVAVPLAADDGKSALTLAEYVLLHQTRNEDAPATHASATTGYPGGQSIRLPK